MENTMKSLGKIWIIAIPVGQHATISSGSKNQFQFEEISRTTCDRVNTAARWCAALGGSRQPLRRPAIHVICARSLNQVARESGSCRAQLHRPLCLCRTPENSLQQHSLQKLYCTFANWLPQARLLKWEYIYIYSYNIQFSVHTSALYLRINLGQFESASVWDILSSSKQLYNALILHQRFTVINL